MKKSILKISILILFFAPNNLMSNTEFFEEGLTLLKTKNSMSQNSSSNRI